MGGRTERRAGGDDRGHPRPRPRTSPKGPSGTTGCGTSSSWPPQRGLALLEVTRPELDRLTGGAVHQGVALQLPAYAYAHPDDLLATALDAAHRALVVALDGVTDPRNLGAIVRSAAAFGAHGVLIPERRAAGMTAAAWKTSAGAAARHPHRPGHQPQPDPARVRRRRAGPGRAGRRGRDRPSTRYPRPSGPLVLVVGSEDAGLSRLVREACDIVAAIPISGAVESLNAGVAAGIALYEITRRRSDSAVIQYRDVAFRAAHTASGRRTDVPEPVDWRRRALSLRRTEPAWKSWPAAGLASQASAGKVRPVTDTLLPHDLPADYQRHRLRGLPGRPGGDRDDRAPHRRCHPGRARRPAELAQADRLRELRLPRGAADHGHLVERQVRRGHRRAPLLRRLPEHRHRRGAGRRARPRAVRGRVRLRPAPLGHRRQPGGLLGHPGPPDRAAGAGRTRRGQERQRPHRGGVGAPAAPVRQPAGAGHVAGRRRPPHPRLPAQHLGQDVPPALLRHRPRDPADRLRPGALGGQGVPAADPDRRLLGVPTADQLRQDARDRRRGGRDLHGRHGPLRRAGGGQGVHRGRGPRAARPPGHLDHPQVAARPARWAGAGHRRSMPTRWTGAVRWCWADRSAT